MVTKIFKKVYKTMQNKAPIIIPPLCKKLKISTVSLTTNSAIKLEFVNSAKNVAGLQSSSNSFKIIFNVNVEGNIDEPLSLTCGNNATIEVEYEEI